MRQSVNEVLLQLNLASGGNNAVYPLFLADRNFGEGD